MLLVGVWSPSPPAGAPWRSVHAAARVLDRLVDRQDEAGGLRRRRQGVDPHDRRLPDAGDEVVGDVLVVDVHAVPNAALRQEAQHGGISRGGRDGELNHADGVAFPT